MVESALVGKPPANEHDKLIIEGFWRFINRHYGPGGPPHPSTIPKKAPPKPWAPSRKGEIIGVTTFIIILILLLSGSRLLTRIFKKNLVWGFDDWVMIPATICLMGYNIVILVGVGNAGFGKHIWEVTYVNYMNYFTGLQIGPTLFYVGIGLVKLSIAFFNKRLVSLTSRKWQWYLNGLIVVYILYIVTAIMIQTIMCWPPFILMKFDNLGARTYQTHCMNTDASSKVLGLVHACFDFFLLPIPLIILRKTRMTTAQRVKLTMLFSLGLLSFIAAVVRATLYMNRSASKDTTYDVLGPKAWTWVDMLSGLACANLPVLNALLPKRWRKGLWSRRTSPSNSDKGSPTRRRSVDGKGVNEGVKEVSITDDSSSEECAPDGTFGSRAARSRRADLEGYHSQLSEAARKQ